MDTYDIKNKNTAFQKHSIERHQVKTAILVDGGFYRKRARSLFGEKTPEQRAKELKNYCYAHLADRFENRYLYRIFYYDCPPSEKNAFHPLTQKSVKLQNSKEAIWNREFFKELKHLRKFALRMGRISEATVEYNLRNETLKQIFSGRKKLEDITESDFKINLEQKGVDMRIGVDISSLSFKKQVNQIILISGDSDFVPAAKQARREGIDFILDPMQSNIKDDLYEHIDGIRTVKNPREKTVRGRINKPSNN